MLNTLKTQNLDDLKIMSEEGDEKTTEKQK